MNFRCTPMALSLLTCLWPHLADAQLHFAETTIQLTADPAATTVTCRFPFSNTGSQPATIRHYLSNCSCLSVALENRDKTTFTPGESGALLATFDLQNLTGEQERQVRLWMSEDPEEQPSFTLNARITIPELITLAPRVVEWKAGEPLATKTVDVTMHHPQPIHIIGLRCTNGAFSNQLETIEPGKRYRIHLSPQPQGDSPIGVGVVNVDTDCKVEKQKSPMLFLVVRPQR